MQGANTGKRWGTRDPDLNVARMTALIITSRYEGVMNPQSTPG